MWLRCMARIKFCALESPTRCAQRLGPLYDADVDLINTDNLTGLSEYIQSQRYRQCQNRRRPSRSGVLGAFVLFTRRHSNSPNNPELTEIDTHLMQCALRSQYS